MNCFRCDKELSPSIGDEEFNAVSDGVVFSTCGGYGSRVFDSMGDETLLIVVCDECLIERSESARLRREFPQRPLHKISPFVPEVFDNDDSSKKSVEDIDLFVDLVNEDVNNRRTANDLLNDAFNDKQSRKRIRELLSDIDLSWTKPKDETLYRSDNGDNDSN